MEIFTISDFLSKDECFRLLLKFKTQYSLKTAEVTGDNSNIRSSSIAFIESISEIDEKLKSILKEKIHLKGYDVTKLNKYQFTEYKEGEYYDWHVDSNKDIYSDRYYSIVIQLNDEYDGGELELKDYITTNIPKKIGTLCMFPSNKLHRVTPVISGVRYSLVNWVRLEENNDYKKTII